MNLGEVIFGARPSFMQSPVAIKAPPRHARWQEVRPKPDVERVRARRAEGDHEVQTAQGKLQAHGGDYIVTYKAGDQAVVRPDIFEKTYAPDGIGAYKKRTDIVLRYFTLERPALIHTLEGEQRAEPGDWIMQGVAGELWPVPQEKALQKYDPL
ncbi:MAG: hypothetical protein WAU68_13685 [Vitreimonas sp.]